MVPSWDVVAAGVIGVIATALAWLTGHKKDEADTKAAAADAAESIAAAAGDVVELVRQQSVRQQEQIAALETRITKLEKELAVMELENGVVISALQDENATLRQQLEDCLE